MFDVSVDGQTLLDNVDIYAQAGSFAGDVKTFVLTADTDGYLDLDFTKVSGSTYEILTIKALLEKAVA